MKLTRSHTAIASLLGVLPMASALLGSTWSVTNVPASGLTDITFPMTLVEVDHISGYYFAQQFNFLGQTNVGYTGIQPRADNATGPVLHGVFSSFIPGTTSTDPNCSNGADGGSGVSCKVEWNGVYGRKYGFEVKSSGNQLWVGTAVDSVTGARIHIGSYTLPAGTQGIKYWQGGFVEWYPWNNGEPANHCAKLPYQRMIFGDPTTTNPGSVGTQAAEYEYGDCVGQVAFSTQRVTGGVQDNCGFRGQTGL